MKRRIVVLLAAAGCGALLSLGSGCAGGEAQAREAAYPEPVGYTEVGSDPSAPPAPGAQGGPGAVAAPPYGPPSSPPPGATDYGPPSAPPPGATAYGPPSGPPAGAGAGYGPPPGSPPGEPGSAGLGASGSDDGTGYSDADPSALSDFRSTLDPYGRWVEDPTYGTVWAPSSSVVGPDFTPYVSGGHWAYDDDYVWVSDYDWGWAPFHYGRWVYAGPMGWEWIPGRAYAGAWVAWRYGMGDWGYVGWAPLGPTWCWRGGVAVGVGFVPRAPYSFVGSHELFGPGIGGRVVTGSQVGVVGAHTQPYVPASPRLGTTTGASVRLAAGGPPLSALHISQAEVVHASAASNRGLAQAQGFSRPSTAVALGARAPQPATPRLSASFPTTRITGAVGRSGGSLYVSAPAYASSPSHFGGRYLGAGFSGSAAAAPPPRSYYGSASYGAPRAAPPSYSAAPSGGMPSGASRGYSAPSGGFHGGYTAPSGGASHGGGSSAPSGGGSHGGGGGGHGGGHR